MCLGPHPPPLARTVGKASSCHLFLNPISSLLDTRVPSLLRSMFCFCPLVGDIYREGCVTASSEYFMFSIATSCAVFLNSINNRYLSKASHGSYEAVHPPIPAHVCVHSTFSWCCPYNTLKTHSSTASPLGPWWVSTLQRNDISAARLEDRPPRLTPSNGGHCSNLYDATTEKLISPSCLLSLSTLNAPLFNVLSTTRGQWSKARKT